MFQKVVHKRGYSEINYIKTFQNAKALEIIVVNMYTEYQLMHNFLDNFQQVVKWREEKFIDQKSLSISDLQIDSFNLENSVRNNEGANFSQSRYIQCGGSHPNKKLFKQQWKVKAITKPPFNPRNSNNKRNECNGRKPNMCFRCGSEYHFIAKFPKQDT